MQKALSRSIAICAKTWAPTWKSTKAKKDFLYNIDVFNHLDKSNTIFSSFPPNSPSLLLTFPELENNQKAPYPPSKMRKHQKSCLAVLSTKKKPNDHNKQKKKKLAKLEFEVQLFLSDSLVLIIIKQSHPVCQVLSHLLWTLGEQARWAGEVSREDSGTQGDAKIWSRLSAAKLCPLIDRVEHLTSFLSLK
jgi:hypothetical protein